MPNRNKEPPYYIVGLPDEPIEAEEAKLKFDRLAGELAKAFPFIEEVRAVVKTKESAKGKSRYEVHVEVYTPKETHAFSDGGFSIAAVFDSLGPKMKRLLSSKQSRVTRSHGESPRKEA
jgi:hypothetical protein